MQEDGIGSHLPVAIKPSKDGFGCSKGPDLQIPMRTVEEHDFARESKSGLDCTTKANQCKAVLLESRRPRGGVYDLRPKPGERLLVLTNYWEGPLQALQISYSVWMPRRPNGTRSPTRKSLIVTAYCIKKGLTRLPNRFTKPLCVDTLHPARRVGYIHAEVRQPGQDCRTRQSKFFSNLMHSD